MHPDALRNLAILLALPLGLVAVSAAVGPRDGTKPLPTSETRFGFAGGAPPETAVASGSVALVGSLTPAGKRFGLTLISSFDSVHEAQEARAVIRGLLVDCARHAETSSDARAQLLDPTRSAPLSPAVSTHLAERGVVMNGLGVGYAGGVDEVDGALRVMSHILVVRNLKADVDGQRENPLAAVCRKLGGHVFSEGGPPTLPPPRLDMTCLARSPVAAADLLTLLQDRLGPNKVRAAGRQLQIGNLELTDFVQRFPLLVLHLEQEGCSELQAELALAPAD